MRCNATLYVALNPVQNTPRAAHAHSKDGAGSGINHAESSGHFLSKRSSNLPASALHSIALSSSFLSSVTRTSFIEIDA